MSTTWCKLYYFNYNVFTLLLPFLDKKTPCSKKIHQNFTISPKHRTNNVFVHYSTVIMSLWSWIDFSNHHRKNASLLDQCFCRTDGRYWVTLILTSFATIYWRQIKFSRIRSYNDVLPTPRWWTCEENTSAEFKFSISVFSHRFWLCCEHGNYVNTVYWKPNNNSGYCFHDHEVIIGYQQQLNLKLRWFHQDHVNYRTPPSVVKSLIHSSKTSA